MLVHVCGVKTFVSENVEGVSFTEASSYHLKASDQHYGSIILWHHSQTSHPSLRIIFYSMSHWVFKDSVTFSVTVRKVSTGRVPSPAVSSLACLQRGCVCGLHVEGNKGIKGLFIKQNKTQNTSTSCHLAASGPFSWLRCFLSGHWLHWTSRGSVHAHTLKLWGWNVSLPHIGNVKN